MLFPDGIDICKLGFAFMKFNYSSSWFQEIYWLSKNKGYVLCDDNGILFSNYFTY